LPGTMVTVASGGTLAGNGTLGGITAQAGSIVAPGNSIGTLNINGNYSAAAGSIYQVEYDGTTSDLINATGTATIASGAGLQAIHYATTPVPLNVRYTVVYAAGGVTGKYTLSGETVASPFVTLHDTYDANHVYLEATQIAPLVPTTPGLALKSGYTVNQINTGGSAQRLAITNSLRQALLYQPTVATALAAFDQISGESHASVKTVLLEDSRFVREAANDRLLGAFCAPGAATLAGAATAPSADCAPATGNVTWGKIFGSTGHIKGDGNAQQADRDIGGVMVGADTSVGNGWRVGGLAGYSRSNMDNVRSSSVKTDDYTLGAYGGNQWDQTSLRLGASYTWHKLDTQRTVAFSGFADSLSAKYDASTSQVFGELGQRMDLGALALEPFAGLAYVSVKTDAFGERGGLSALHGSGDAIDASFGTLGVRASADVSDATQLHGMLGWRHAFSAVTPSSTHAFAGGTAFSVYGVPIARDVAVIEAGLETVLRPDLTLGASYSGQFGSGLKDNGFKVTLGLKF
jgi:outer membrane autotransporter protein